VAVVAAGTIRRLTSPAIRLEGRAEVIDGDSLKLQGQELRLQGIDAPEFRQTCLRGERHEPCGILARQALRDLLGDHVLACTIDGHDRYGRGLARCRVGSLDVNRAMVLEGQAVAFGDFEAEETEARRLRNGVWGTTFERPADWRLAHSRSR
jgi:endonuclease YncB( thermonuclease family)